MIELQLKIIGAVLVLLGVFHAFFPSYFKWKTELPLLSLINKQMMEVHTLFIGLTVILMGLLCLFEAPDLVHTALGRKISLGLAVFWFIRLYVQFFVYSPALWKGKRFETGVHVGFSLLWLYLTLLFCACYF